MWLLLALTSAVCFGLRGICYHWTSKKQLDRNLTLFGVFASGAVGSLALTLLTGQQWTPAVLTGLMMGLFSFAANASLFKGFAVGKSSLIAIMSGLPPVVVVILAYALWGETLTAGQWVAFALIVTGILVVRYSDDLRKGGLQGLQWGVLVMMFFGLNDMSGKLSTRLHADLFPTLTLMFIMGSVCFGGWWLLGNRKRKLEQETEPGHQPNHVQANGWTPRRTFFTGMLIGLTNLCGMVLIVSAFRTGVTGLVSAVVALNILMILLYTHVFVKEKLRPTEWSGVALAVGGILVLQLA
ncbi:EamA family transporter [Paenibacillus chartarius]|uniref:EamA family transporter n=1 Tax=Paenibacillus chartarius TaxID=747481 RepID=A0ABV6DP99_9BACL